MRCCAIRKPSSVTNGSTPLKLRHALRRIGDRVEHRPRQPQPRRPPSDEAGDVGEHIGKEDVLAAEDIALADPAALERGDVTRRDVIDMGEVQPGVDEGRHASRRGLDDDAACRRRPHVARADRRRRVDDDGRQPVPTDHGLDQTFGRDLAALIGADRRSLGQRMVFGRGAALDELQGRRRCWYRRCARRRRAALPS